MPDDPDFIADRPGDLASLLAELELREPGDYFAGQRQRWTTLPDRVLAFVRRHRIAPAASLHHRHVLLLTLSGGGACVRDGVAVDVEPGQAVLILPFERHHFLPRASDLRWLFLTCTLADDAPLHALRGAVLPCGAGIWAAAAAVLRALRDDAGVGSAGVPLLALLDRLCASRPVRRRPAADSLAAHALAYIHAQIAGDCRLPTIAAELGVSRSVLAGRFREEYGQSLGATVRQCRLELAGRLLQHGEAGLASVAAACGFTSPFAFARAFKRHYGQAPGGWRRSARSPDGPRPR